MIEWLIELLVVVALTREAKEIKSMEDVNETKQNSDK